MEEGVLVVVEAAALDAIRSVKLDACDRCGQACCPCAYKGMACHVNRRCECLFLMEPRPLSQIALGYALS